jgi:hypothetical protein
MTADRPCVDLPLVPTVTEVGGVGHFLSVESVRLDWS